MSWPLFENIDFMKEDGPKFTKVMADPPWSYSDKCNSGKRGASHKYPCMDYRDVAALPVRKILANDALVGIWFTGTHIKEALFIVEAWGLDLICTDGFVWVKTTAKGKHHYGMGHYTRKNAECCLFARRGHPKIVSHKEAALIVSPALEHSRKPDEALLRFGRLLHGPSLELFARRPFPGWYSWGNEIQTEENKKR